MSGQPGHICGRGESAWSNVGGAEFEAVDGVEGCPGCWLEAHPIPIDNVFAHYNRYKVGILYCNGGWEDQPALYASVMEACEQIDIEQQRRELDAAKARANER